MLARVARIAGLSSMRVRALILSLSVLARAVCGADQHVHAVRCGTQSNGRGLDKLLTLSVSSKRASSLSIMSSPWLFSCSCAAHGRRKDIMRE